MSAPIDQALKDLEQLATNNNVGNKYNKIVEILMTLYQRHFDISRRDIQRDAMLRSGALTFAHVTLSQVALMNGVLEDEPQNLLHQFLTEVLMAKNNSAYEVIRTSVDFTKTNLSPRRKKSTKLDDDDSKYLNRKLLAINNLGGRNTKKDGNRLNEVLKQGDLLPAQFEKDEELFIPAINYHSGTVRCEHLQKYAECINRAMHWSSVTEDDKSTLSAKISEHQNEIENNTISFHLDDFLYLMQEVHPNLVTEKIDEVESKWFTNPYPRHTLKGTRFLLAVELTTWMINKSSEDDPPENTKRPKKQSVRMTLYHPPTGMLFPSAEKFDVNADGQTIMKHRGPIQVGTRFRSNIAWFDLPPPKNQVEKADYNRTKNNLFAMLTDYFHPNPPEGGKVNSRARDIQITKLVLLTVKEGNEEGEQTEDESNK